MQKKDKKYDKMKDEGFSKHGPAWHGKDPIADVVGEALQRAKEMFKKMNGKKKGGSIMIEIEKKGK